MVSKKSLECRNHQTPGMQKNVWLLIGSIIGVVILETKKQVKLVIVITQA